MDLVTIVFLIMTSLKAIELTVNILKKNYNGERNGHG